jgi:hypothetical protein
MSIVVLNVIINISKEYIASIFMVEWFNLLIFIVSGSAVSVRVCATYSNTKRTKYNGNRIYFLKSLSLKLLQFLLSLLWFYCFVLVFCRFSLLPNCLPFASPPLKFWRLLYWWTSLGYPSLSFALSAASALLNLSEPSEISFLIQDSLRPVSDNNMPFAPHFSTQRWYSLHIHYITLDTALVENMPIAVSDEHSFKKKSFRKYHDSCNCIRSSHIWFSYTSCQLTMMYLCKLAW